MTAKSCAALIDDVYGIFVEDYFAELLRVERKRTERSKTPFLLMLFDISRLSEIVGGKDIKRNVLKAIRTLVRDIDVIGWYSYDTVAGILFREMKKGHAYLPSVREKLLHRMYRALNRDVDRGVVKRIFVSFHSFPEHDVGTASSAPLDVSLYPEMSVTNESPERVSLFFLKTAMDLLGSILGIIILSPFMLFIAVLVKCSSKGPILFRQERVGLFGKFFTFLKFRTMYVGQGDEIHKQFVTGFIRGNAGERGESGKEEKVYKLVKDPRITKIGRFLRATSLDELPQLFNVVRGEMSLVGPRPPLPYEYEQYDIWHKARLVEFRPGITGLWQVEGRSSTSFDEMVRLDLKYMREWSLWLDIKIVLKTPWVAFTGKGGY